MLNIMALKTGAKQFHYGTIPLRLIRCGLYYQEPPDKSMSPSAAPRGNGAPCFPAAVLRDRGGSQGALQASEPGAPALPRAAPPRVPPPVRGSWAPGVRAAHRPREPPGGAGSARRGPGRERGGGGGAALPEAGVPALRVRRAQAGGSRRRARGGGAARLRERPGEVARRCPRSLRPRLRSCTGINLWEATSSENKRAGISAPQRALALPD